MLTQENYSKGMLVDEELLAGVSEHPETQGLFVAYVMNHLTAEYLHYHEFSNLTQALEVVNQIKRPWQFEKTGGCGGCGGDGGCDGGGCKKGNCGKEEGQCCS